MKEAAHETMSCMEVWGGNRSTWSQFVVPGLDLWVYSQPFDDADLGGDVYYLSSCASGRITRIFLGDVSGHGSEAAPLGAKLRDMMRKNVNYIDQSRVVEFLNDEFEEASTAGRFATAIVSTYFAPSRQLSVCTAGHPPPLIYRVASGLWEIIGNDDAGLRNIPIGVLGEWQFTATNLKLTTGDIFLAYSDALSEARHPNGKLLNADGIAHIANSLDVENLSGFVDDLLQRIRDLHSQNLNSDDATVMLGRANEERVPLKDNLLAPFRYVGGFFGS